MDTSLATARILRFLEDTGEPMAVGRRVIPAPRVVRPERVRPSVLGRVSAPLGRTLRGLTDGFGQPRALPVSL